MSWGEVTRGWSEIYENSPKVQRFFEEKAPDIAKHAVSYISGSPAAGNAVGKTLAIGGESSSTIKKAAGSLAYAVAVGTGTGVLGLAATALAPIWIPIAIYASLKED
jgi:hypothetical protein